MKERFLLVLAILSLSMGCATANISKPPKLTASDETKAEFYESHRIVDTDVVLIPPPSPIVRVVTGNVELANGQRTSDTDDLKPAIFADSPTAYAIRREAECMDGFKISMGVAVPTFIIGGVTTGLALHTLSNVSSLPNDLKSPGHLGSLGALVAGGALLATSAVASTISLVYLNAALDAREDAFMHYNTSLQQALQE